MRAKLRSVERPQRAWKVLMIGESELNRSAGYRTMVVSYSAGINFRILGSLEQRLIEEMSE